MENSFTIRITCPDGNLENMWMANTMTWPGKFFCIFRDFWKSIEPKYQQELTTPGIYVLAGVDDSCKDNNDYRKDIYYIGQTDDLHKRIETHVQDPEKYFWRCAICIVGSGIYLATHFKWMEAYLIEKANQIEGSILQNKNIPARPSISEAEVSDIKRFLNEALRIFPLANIHLFTTPKLSNEQSLIFRQLTEENSTRGYGRGRLGGQPQHRNNNESGPRNERGRGVWMTSSEECLLHLGDRLLFPKTNQIVKLEHGPKPEVYCPEKPMYLANFPENTKAVHAMAKALEGYQWRGKSDSIGFIGWLIAAPIGGVLQHRPHIWLSGKYTNDNKTWLLTNVVRPLLNDWLIFFADATPAALRREVAVGARPVLFDALEIRGNSGRMLSEEVDTIMRAATRERGPIMVAAESGREVKHYHSRASFLLSYATWPTRNPVPTSEMTPIKLSRTEINNYPEICAGIKLAMQKKDEILSAILYNAEHIKNMIDASIDRVMSNSESGDAHQRGTLIGAAAWAFGVAMENLPEHVDQMILSMGRCAVATKSDELIDEILNAQVPTNNRTQRNMSVEEMVKSGEFKKELGDYGIRVTDTSLLLATRHPGLKQLIRNTAFANDELGKLLLRREGAHECRRVRVGGRRHSHVIALELSAV